MIKDLIGAVIVQYLGTIDGEETTQYLVRLTNGEDYVIELAREHY